MADEITFKCSTSYAGKAGSSEGASSFAIPERTFTFDQTGKDYTKGTQAIGTSALEQLAVSADIGTQGWWQVWNLNANTGVVKLALSGQTALVKILPGDPPACFRANGAVFAQGSSAIVNVEFVCFEF